MVVYMYVYLVRWGVSSPHFTEQDTEKQRGKVTNFQIITFLLVEKPGSKFHLF